MYMSHAKPHSSSQSRTSIADSSKESGTWKVPIDLDNHTHAAHKEHDGNNGQWGEM
jgi:hypothetical protein